MPSDKYVSKIEQDTSKWPMAKELDSLFDEPREISKISARDRFMAISDNDFAETKRINSRDNKASEADKEKERAALKKITDPAYEALAVEFSQMSEAEQTACFVKLAQRLESSPDEGLAKDKQAAKWQARVNEYGGNWFPKKRLKSYAEFMWAALQDTVLILLIVMASITLVVEMGFGAHPETGWIESAAIYMSVLIIINVAAKMDHNKQAMFEKLSAELKASNIKTVLRGGENVQIPDNEIVVGDILLFNAHSMANIPADGILLEGNDVKMDESALTGEPIPVDKNATAPFVLSGTIVSCGSGKLLIVAVGPKSVNGKIKMDVYGGGGGGDEPLGCCASWLPCCCGEEDEDEDPETPLSTKINNLAEAIGQGGLAASLTCFLIMFIKHFVNGREDHQNIMTYIITGITILAVAVPEGLPLAVILSLAFSSKEMYKQNNLVKELDSCETMGSATTICTDKTGTLTANEMTVRGVAIGTHSIPSVETIGLPGKNLGEVLTGEKAMGGATKEMLTNCVCICTMQESYLQRDEFNPSSTKRMQKGNPTECALLALVEDMGIDYSKVREATPGRSSHTRGEGKERMFTSSRKLMSWGIPIPDGSGMYRVYAKGAGEILLGRCTKAMNIDGSIRDVSDADRDEITNTIITPYANEAMRTIGMAYRDVNKSDLNEMHESVKNSDGSPAFMSETELTLIAITGIEDPLRPDVPPAIDKCYVAGIDVRMVTGDNLDTAIAIARRAHILSDSLHYETVNGKRQIKKNCAMLGSDFRKKVGIYKSKKMKKKEAEEEGGESKEEEEKSGGGCFGCCGKKEEEEEKKGDDEDNGDEHDPTKFNQEEFDKIWPYLRVLARSSPEDKTTLAHGLNQSELYKNTAKCEEMLQNEKIRIFHDRQVVAMTGDGTNDAPALKHADVGFAMGISGTQIAKDAANIILLDDNFASIVVAAKWGRNVYDSISKFLQFQLTVNIVAVTCATIGAIAHNESPLAAVQMLWVNLLMDSLASLALATEPPAEDVLQRLPVNRTASIITRQMWWNMLGQSVYQLVIVLVMLFMPQLIPSKGGDELTAGHIYYIETHNPSEHYTFIFNAFVWMQLFNEINCRKLHGEINVFHGILSNAYFLGIWFSTAIVQVCMIQFFGRFVRVCDGGLSIEQWGYCLAIGAFSLIWQQVINFIRYIVPNKQEKETKIDMRRRSSLPQAIVTPGSPVAVKK